MPSFITEFKWLPLSLLLPQEEQLKVRPVVKDEAFRELVNSVKEKGLENPFLVMPLKVPKGSYSVINGNRRLEACREAFSEKRNVEVPCLIGPENMSAMDQVALATIDNTQRENMNPAQIYGVIKTLRKMGISTQSKQAETLGISTPYLSQITSAGRSGRLSRGGPVVVRKPAQQPQNVQRTETFIGHCPKCKAKLQVKREFDSSEQRYVWSIENL